MTILIIDDEPPIAAYIESLTRTILKDKVDHIHIIHTLEEARIFLQTKTADLCLLDLNLSGSNGFDLLKSIMVLPLQCIIISAYCEKAITAFEYGVIDFVPKPFNSNRLQLAFDRYFNIAAKNVHTKHLVYRLGNQNRLLGLEDVSHFTACRIFVEAFTRDGRKILLEKHLNQLERMLPDHFVRIHRSHLVNLHEVSSYQRQNPSGHELCMRDGTRLPISRHRYAHIQKILNR